MNVTDEAQEILRHFSFPAIKQLNAYEYVVTSSRMPPQTAVMVSRKLNKLLKHLVQTEKTPKKPPPTPTPSKGEPLKKRRGRSKRRSKK